MPNIDLIYIGLSVHGNLMLANNLLYYWLPMHVNLMVNIDFVMCWCQMRDKVMPNIKLDRSYDINDKNATP